MPRGSVRFLGRVEDADLHSWLRTARVLCSLSEHEAYGLAPAEALAAGARVVLSDIPAHTQFTAIGRAGGAELVALVDANADDAALSETLCRAVTADPPPSDAPSPIPGWDEIGTRLAALYISLRQGVLATLPVGVLA